MKAAEITAGVVVRGQELRHHTLSGRWYLAGQRLPAKAAATAAIHLSKQDDIISIQGNGTTVSFRRKESK